MNQDLVSQNSELVVDGIEEKVQRTLQKSQDAKTRVMLRKKNEKLEYTKREFCNRTYDYCFNRMLIPTFELDAMSVEELSRLGDVVARRRTLPALLEGAVFSLPLVGFTAVYLLFIRTATHVPAGIADYCFASLMGFVGALGGGFIMASMDAGHGHHLSYQICRWRLRRMFGKTSYFPKREAS